MRACVCVCVRVCACGEGGGGGGGGVVSRWIGGWSLKCQLKFKQSVLAHYIGYSLQAQYQVC